jgi:hypothetical protein
MPQATCLSELTAETPASIPAPIIARPGCGISSATELAVPGGGQNRASNRKGSVRWLKGKSLSQRFDDYHPSKTVLFWSCAGCIVATMIVGFSWGGWVTGGTAEDMATDALEQGRAEVAAVVCVEEFMNGAEARMQLASLKDIRSSWQRENFIEEGGWAMVAGQEYDDAAELCAERLIEMEAPPAQEAATTETGTVAQ